MRGEGGGGDADTDGSQGGGTGAGARTVGCPCCWGKKTSVTNSIATKFPAVAAKWSPPSDGLNPERVRPDNLLESSNVNVWFRCGEGPDHVWQLPLQTALKVDGALECPCCRGKKVSVTNSLKTIRPDIAKMWCEEVRDAFWLQYNVNLPTLLSMSSQLPTSRSFLRHKHLPPRDSPRSSQKNFESGLRKGPEGVLAETEGSCWVENDEGRIWEVNIGKTVKDNVLPVPPPLPPPPLPLTQPQPEPDVGLMGGGDGEGEVKRGANKGVEQSGKMGGEEANTEQAGANERWKSKFTKALGTMKFAAGFRAVMRGLGGRQKRRERSDKLK